MVTIIRYRLACLPKVLYPNHYGSPKSLPIARSNLSESHTSLSSLNASDAGKNVPTSACPLIVVLAGGPNVRHSQPLPFERISAMTRKRRASIIILEVLIRQADTQGGLILCAHRPTAFCPRQSYRISLLAIPRHSGKMPTFKRISQCLPWSSDRSNLNYKPTRRGRLPA